MFQSQEPKEEGPSGAAARGTSAFRPEKSLSEDFLDRRSFLQAIGALMALSALEWPIDGVPRGTIVPEDKLQLEHFLERLELESIAYFISNRAPGTGLVLDRASNSAERDANRFHGMASIAATGYGLAAMALAAEKKLIARDKAAELVLENLRFVQASTPAGQRGWLHHFVHADTGRPFRMSEVSSIDTALYYMGALVAAEYFQGDVLKKFNQMVHAIDFKYMLTNGNTQPAKQSFSHGFYTDGRLRFIPWNWDHFSEGILIPFLALGVGQNGITEKVWNEGWDRGKHWSYAGERSFSALPLFTYYYPLGFLNLKDRMDGQGENLWAEAQKAVRMQRAFCRDNHYPAGLFGISACDGPHGYSAFFPGHNYGSMTIAPTALLASLPLAEREVFEGLSRLEKLGLCDREFGLAGAFDCATGWTAQDALGIDVGSTLLMIDAYRRGLVHSLTEKNPIVKRAMQRCGFRAV